jgi:hypothetical protein
MSSQGVASRWSEGCLNFPVADDRASPEDHKEKNKMNHRYDDNKLDAVMELLIENGFKGFADVLRILLNEAMKNHAGPNSWSTVIPTYRHTQRLRKRI